MSTYNYSVLKSNPITLNINGEKHKVYKIKWHGNDFSLETYCQYNRPLPWQQPHDWFYFEIIQRRADHAWGNERPTYVVCTGAHYDGKLHWDDPYHQEHGFDVFKCNVVSFQEDIGIKNKVGTVFKRGRGKYEFIPVEQPEQSREVCAL
jgi:hypothetical protein